MSHRRRLATALCPNSPPRHVACLGENCCACLEFHAIVFTPPPVARHAQNSARNSFALRDFADLACRPQILHRRLRPPEPESEAYIGQPYGVGRWTVQLPPGVNPALLGNSGFTLSEKNGRVIYQPSRPSLFARPRARSSAAHKSPMCIFFSRAMVPWNCNFMPPPRLTPPSHPSPIPVGHERLISDWWVGYSPSGQRHQPLGRLSFLGRQLSAGHIVSPFESPPGQPNSSPHRFAP